MSSQALGTFRHAIQDSTDLLKHFDTLNRKPPPPDIEVLKRASLIMALAALETYFEDRIVEAVESVCRDEKASTSVASFYRCSLDADLKLFHSPSTERVQQLFRKYLDLEVTDAWRWNNCTPVQARAELNRLVRKRGEIAHRSLRPGFREARPNQHAVTRDGLRKHIHFISEMASATDAFLLAHGC